MFRKIELIYFISIISFASVGAVIISPALVNISSSLHIDINNIGRVINIFLLGYALSQLMYSGLGLYFERKTLLYAGSSVAFFGYIICFFSVNEMFLLVGRFISALGGGCGLAIIFGYISDYYQKDDAAKKMISYTSSAFAIMPGIAVILGSIINGYYGWRYIFLSMALYSVFIFIVSIKLPRLRKSEISINNNVNTLLHDFKHYAIPSIVWGLCGSIIYMFSSDLVIISIKEFKLTNMQFGIIYSLSMTGYFFGNILSGFMQNYTDRINIIKSGVCLSIISAFLFFMTAMFKTYMVYFLSVFLIYISLPMIFSIMIGQAMKKVKNTNFASSISSFICMVVSVLISSIASIYMSVGMYYIKETIFTIIIISFILIFVLAYFKRSGSQFSDTLLSD